MNSDLQNTVEQVQAAVPITVFYLRGRLDAQSGPQLVQWATEAYQNDARYLLLDFSELETLTSSGMRVLHEVYKLFTPEGTSEDYAHLRMASAPPQIYHALKVTGFLQIIPIYESVQLAIDTFKVP